MKKTLILAALTILSPSHVSAEFALSAIAGSSTQITATADVNRYEQCTQFSQAMIVASMSGATKAGDKFTVNLRCGTAKFPSTVVSVSADGGSDVQSALVSIPPGTAGILYLDVSPATMAGSWEASMVMK
jgi:hypothetical protein